MGCDVKRLAIIGSALAGGAVQIIDALSPSSIYKPVAIFDNDANHIGKCVSGVEVLASSERVEDFWRRGHFDEIIIAVGGDLIERERQFLHFRDLGIPLANVIDETVRLGIGASIGAGNVLLSGVYIGPSVKVGDNCYVVSNTTINHDTSIGSSCYFSSGCVISGNVKIGNRVRFNVLSGAAAKVRVYDDQVIAAGSIISS